MKARNDRLDIRSSRRLPFTILAQANFLFADMNPIKNTLLSSEGVVGFVGREGRACGHGRGLRGQGPPGGCERGDG